MSAVAGGRGQHLLVAAGQTAHVHDISSGVLVRRYPTGDPGDALASLRVEGTRDGRLLIAGEPYHLTLQQP